MLSSNYLTNSPLVKSTLALKYNRLDTVEASIFVINIGLIPKQTTSTSTKEYALTVTSSLMPLLLILQLNIEPFRITASQLVLKL